MHQRRRYPYPPGPWRTHLNLPVQMQDLPMEYLRRDMTVTAPRILQAVLTAQKTMNPFALLPRRYGPGSVGAPGGVAAVAAADQRLADIAAYARSSVGAPPPSAPPQVALAFAGTVGFPAEAASNIPFAPRSGLPPVAMRAQARLRHLPQREGYRFPAEHVLEAVQRAGADIEDLGRGLPGQEWY